MTRPRYKEESTIRAFLKKRALQKGKRKKDGKPVQAVAPYMFFFHCLEDQERSIKKILSIIKSAEKGKQSAAAAYAAKPKMSTDFAEIADEMRLESEAVEHESSQEIFAGTLFVIFNSLLMSMSSRVKMRGGSDAPKVAGRQIGKTSLLELIRAASNNFRHYEEWNKKLKEDKRMAQTIAVLKAAGIKGPYNRNVCAEVFDLIGWKSVKKMTREIRKLASEIFQAQTGIPL